MKKMTAFALACAGSLSVVAWAAGGDDRDLIEAAAADRRAPVAVPADAGPAKTSDLDAVEAQPRSEAALAQARLELVLARKSLKAGDAADAARRARAALVLLEPAGGDVSVWELQAEGILARASRAQARVTLSDSPQEAATAPAAAAASPATPDAPRTATIVEQDEARLAYQGALYEAYSADETRRLIEAHEARVAPQGEVAYPADWKDRVARRAKWAGGEVARTRSWTDKDGREWYAAIYDIRDVTYVVPDFQPVVSLDFAENDRNGRDREALRQRSAIFGGYAEDLAAGIPLLRFFGGVDDMALRGAKYSREKQAEIIEQIRAFTTQQTEALVIPLNP
ncbi:MAG: hypothetical protein IT450_07070 [Phycisphaerales bacterium]|nr:hypothetical protein [Phycisphaerales bacterium]